MKSITVFCGSSCGNESTYIDLAFQLGQSLAERSITVVYGGANVGLMGALANGALENNGKVIGVIPDFLLQKEIAHHHLTQLIIVESMHERKTKMNDLSDGVIALPGGYGTLEELFEMITWAQLGLHQKPIALLNINGFYDHLICHIQKMTETGFLKKSNQKILLVDNQINRLIHQMESYQPNPVEKWITKNDL